MAITREKKTELLATYKEQIQNSTAIVFTNYRGLSVSKIQSLRAKLGETDTGYMVVKNSLMGLALEESELPKPEDLLNGPNAVAFVGEDIGRGVSALMDWIKAERIVEITGAMLGESVLDAQRAEALADLPTKEETLALVLGAISAPARNVAQIVNAPGSSLARVLNARIEQMKEAEEAA